MREAYASGMRKTLFLVVGSLAMVACAGPGANAPATPAADELVMWSNGTATSLKMNGDRAWGPGAELTRFDGAYRGTFNGRTVDLHLEGDRVFGMIGSSKVDLHVSGDGAQVHGEGLLNGQLSNFDIDDASLAGTFGLCSYQMKRKDPASQDGRYLGYQSCNGAAYPAAHVTIPEYFRTLSALDQATLYSILLVG